MLKIEIDEKTGKGEIQMVGSLLTIMNNITVILQNIYYHLNSVEAQEAFHKLLKDIVNKQIYINDEDEVKERDRKFNRIIDEIDKTEEEK